MLDLGTLPEYEKVASLSDYPFILILLLLIPMVTFMLIAYPRINRKADAKSKQGLKYLDDLRNRSLKSFASFMGYALWFLVATFCFLVVMFGLAMPNSITQLVDGDTNKGITEQRQGIAHDWAFDTYGVDIPKESFETFVDDEPKDDFISPPSHPSSVSVVTEDDKVIVIEEVDNHLRLVEDSGKELPRKK